MVLVRADVFLLQHADLACHVFRVAAAPSTHQSHIQDVVKVHLLVQGNGADGRFVIR